jgi:nucleoside 2-deoxyribosyltransferase
MNDLDLPELANNFRRSPPAENLDVLRGKRCYLSGPIENDSTQFNWRDAPKRVLGPNFGIDLFDPFDDPKQIWVEPLKKARDECNFPEMARIAKAFVRKDLCMVDRADFVVAYLPYKVPTTGTVHEIIVATNAKKPTLLMCPQGKQFVPLWFYGFIPHECMFSDWEGVYQYLNEVNQGYHKTNNRWSFVYGMV